jgi:Rrf2 family protein
MLSKKAKYAINALVYLAKNYKQGPVLISEISESQRIPQKFLEAILLELKKDGMLNSKKGKGGGYYLIKSPEEVNMADVIRSMDGAIALLPCVAHKYYEPCEECKDEMTCGIRAIFSEVRNETVLQLKRSTLASILEQEELLIRAKSKLHKR